MYGEGNGFGTELNEVRVDIPEPTLHQKILATAFVCSRGAHNSGIRTKAILMWPVRKFFDYQVDLEAANFLGNALFDALSAPPEQDCQQTLKRQLCRVSGCATPEQLSGKGCKIGLIHRLPRQALVSGTFSDSHHQNQPGIPDYKQTLFTTPSSVSVFFGEIRVTVEGVSIQPERGAA